MPRPHPPERNATEKGRPAATSSPRLSQQLEELARRAAASETVSLREVVSSFQGRGGGALLLLLVLPFCLPLPVPGLSTVFGLAIAFLGLRQTLGQGPRLPKAIAERRLPAKAFSALLFRALPALRTLERLAKPRLAWLSENRAARQGHGVAIMIMALLLSLPVPVPFTNFVPALAVALLALGEMERDGGWILAGYVVAGAALLLFVLLFLGPVVGLHRLLSTAGSTGG
ncbi:MAG: exopolysaccharide biosynthesis protein [Methylacidiphilaceae bacterium]|nr:exopolysaccharide biosynthesis protein [Candidatus Methylacidiphilaceae bacterium]